MSLEELQDAENGKEPGNHDLRNLLILLGLIALPPVVLIVGSLVSQSFYDSVVFEFYWGPIANDAGATTASQSSYNKVNTVTNGVMAVFGSIATYIIFKNRFKRTNTKVDLWFYLAVLPLIIGGAVYRALEDALVFERPFRYFFITPIIYAALWAVAVLLALYTFQVLVVYKNRRAGGCVVRDNPVANLFSQVPGIIYLVLPLFAMDLFYAWVYWSQTDWHFVLPHPVLVFLISFLFMGAMYYIQRDQGKKLEFFTVFTFYSAFIMLIGVAQIITWPNDSAWLDHFEGADHWWGLNLYEYPMVLSLALLCTIGISVPAFIAKRRWPRIAPFASGPNILIMFSHFLDASATYRALDFHDNYVEKHVLPRFFIDLFGTAVVMFPLKALLVIMLIFVIDVYFEKFLPEDRDERFEYQVLFGLIKIVVIMVGLAPGLRDIFRLAMGV